MPEHIMRDATLVNDTFVTQTPSSLSYQSEEYMMQFFYYMLRVMGWSHIWECDGGEDIANNPNHVPDGNMEGDLSNWTNIVSGIGTKETAVAHVRSGTKSLKLVTLATSDGVESAVLTSLPPGNQGAGGVSWVSGNTWALGIHHLDDIPKYYDQHTGDVFEITSAVNPENLGDHTIIGVGAGAQALYTDLDAIAENGNIRYYNHYPVQFKIWAKNVTNSSTFAVEFDNGKDGYQEIGTMPYVAGNFVEYNFSGTAKNPNCKLKIIDKDGTGGTIYIDSIMCYHSFFEYSKHVTKGADGITQNNNEFRSTGYAFVGGDVGKYIFFHNQGTPNRRSTGCFEITSVVAGVATLDLKSGSYTLIADTGLTWFLVDVKMNTHYGWCLYHSYCGFGLESPHTSKQRIFARIYYPSGAITDKHSVWWGAPSDTDFDQSTGNFYNSGPSTQRSLQDHISVDDRVKQYTQKSLYLYGSTIITTRCSMWIDEAGAYVKFLCYANSATSGHVFMFFGYTGSDSDHPGIEEWAFLMPWGGGALSEDSITYESFAASDWRAWHSHGCSIGPTGLARATCTLSTGFGGTTLCPWQGADQSVNQFSGNEVMRKPRLLRDRLRLGGETSRRILDRGIFIARDGLMDMTTFDSDNYLHIRNGVVCNWDGESRTP